MNGHVFQTSEEQSDRMQYKRSVEALELYVKKNLKFAEDLAPLFAFTMAEPKIKIPVEPRANPSRTEDMIYAEQIKQYVKHQATLTINLASTHAVIWGQCSETMKTRVRTLSGYRERAEGNDCFWFLQKIRGIIMELQEKKHSIMSMLDARWNLLNCRQAQSQSVGDYK
jgi:hypothetical protein